MLPQERPPPKKMSLDNITSFMLPFVLALRVNSQISIELLQMKRETYVGFNCSRLFPSEEHDINKLFLKKWFCFPTIREVSLNIF